MLQRRVTRIWMDVIRRERWTKGPRNERWSFGIIRLEELLYRRLYKGIHFSSISLFYASNSEQGGLDSTRIRTTDSTIHKNRHGQNKQAIPGESASIVQARAHSLPQRSPDTYKRGNPDGPGAWKHDLHTSVKQSLASRQTSFKSRPTLLDRISGGQGKELFPTSSSLSKLYGFGDRPPANTANNPNAGLELLPQNNRVKKGNTSKGRLVDTGLNAALGLGGNGKKSVRRVERPQRSVESVSIMGAARGTTWVKVEHLALGTTADDVMVGHGSCSCSHRANHHSPRLIAIC